MTDQNNSQNPSDVPTEPFPQSPSQPVDGDTPSIQPEGPGWAKRALTATLSPETRVGKVMRPVLRWVATVVGLFALGLLAGYLFLYQPTQTALDLARMTQRQAEEALTLKSQTLQTTEKKLLQTQDELNKMTLRSGLLQVMAEVSAGRVALAEKDGAKARTYLEQAQVSLAAAMPLIQKQDKDLADVLKGRLEIALKEMAADPVAAQQDLGILYARLVQLDSDLFGKK